MNVASDWCWLAHLQHSFMIFVSWQQNETVEAGYGLRAHFKLGIARLFTSGADKLFQT